MGIFLWPQFFWVLSGMVYPDHYGLSSQKINPQSTILKNIQKQKRFNTHLHLYYSAKMNKRHNKIYDYNSHVHRLYYGKYIKDRMIIIISI